MPMNPALRVLSTGLVERIGFDCFHSLFHIRRLFMEIAGSYPISMLLRNWERDLNAERRKECYSILVLQFYIEKQKS